MTAEDVDLNLLRVLDALLEEGSVAKAAVRLHLSAPAVSRSPVRLRRALDDPLFVRSGRGLEPTPRAIELQAGVRSALEQATAVLTPAPGTFDPAGLDRRFRISAGDAIVAAIGLRLVDRVRSAAPNVSISFLPDTNEAELLRSGQADLDLGSAHGLGSQIESHVLFHDRFVVAMSAGNPMTSPVLTAKRFAEAEHIVVSSKGDGFGSVDLRLGELGLTRRSVTAVPSFIVALHLVAEANAIAVLPHAVVRAFATRLPVVHRELPISLPELPVTQSWHHRNSNDPAHQWLRDTVASISVSPHG